MGRERQGSQNSLNIPFPTPQLSNSYLSASQASSSSQLNITVPPSGSVSAASSSAHLPLSNSERSPDHRRPYQPSFSPARSGSLPMSTHSSADSLPVEDLAHHPLPPPAMPLASPPTAKTSLSSMDSQGEPLAGPSSGYRSQPQVVVQPASTVEYTNGSGSYSRSSQDVIDEAEEEEGELAPPSRPYTSRESPFISLWSERMVLSFHRPVTFNKPFIPARQLRIPLDIWVAGKTIGVPISSRD